MTRRRLTRREFLEQTARHTAGAGLAGVGLAGVGLAGIALPTLSCSPADQEIALAPLPLDERTLTAVIDEIIPAGEGMPSASEAGVVRYFRQIVDQLPDLTESLGGALEAVENESHERFESPFLDLSESERVEVLEQLATAGPAIFGGLSTLVYEAYYVQPTVWELIGYEPYPTGEAGPVMDPFDEAALDRVRSMPPSYREVL